MSSSLKYQEQSQSVRYFKYELYHQIPIREPWCGILQLNHQQTLLFAAGAMRILIFQFKNTLKPLFQIREESQAISNIFTKQNSNQVFVGNCQGNIKIFQTIGINNTKIQIKIKAHKKSITSFVMSKDASLLITCSLDGQIKFWTFEDSFSYKQTINSHEGGVCKISLNQSENQIISCGKQKFIFIIEQSSFNKRWFISQKIELESYGYGICFISENLFAFQSTQNQDILFIYQRQKGTQLYNQIKDFQLNYNSQYCLFIQQFIAQKSLLISKKGNFIIVKEETNIQLLENSAVEFDIIDVYGSVSDDGEYLISCDDQSKVISIRKYKMI
ncbi:unnamed protein product [Paramecium sonneborni]|uniref:Uncharacterized protein n=1 Tax=Paramecium sonneborni TaxID=65129 RepID=A0A8S1RM04_9CILI|nr:unnamed protein product [Paramecium sonneborni]